MIETQYELLFDGRTLVVECVFETRLRSTELAEVVRMAAAGPKLRLVLGSISRRLGGYSTRTFVNTDETDWELAKRMNHMKPKPGLVTVGLVSAEEAKEIWGKFHKLPQVQQGN